MSQTTTRLPRRVCRSAWIAAAAVLLGILGGWLAPGTAQDATWNADLLVGGAWNADSKLTIEQRGEPTIAFDAEWETDPFAQPLYWALRVNRERRDHGWALELLHHKIYLKNGPPEVDAFSISHGLNYLTAQHAWIRSQWRWLASLGIAIAHRENTVRGRPLEETGGLFDHGYELTGPVLGVGAGTILPIAGALQLTLEARVIQSWIRVDVADGRAHTSNLALHLLVGPRLRFAGPPARTSSARVRRPV